MPFRYNPSRPSWLLGGTLRLPSLPTPESVVKPDNPPPKLSGLVPRYDLDTKVDHGHGRYDTKCGTAAPQQVGVETHRGGSYGSRGSATRIISECPRGARMALKDSLSGSQNARVFFCGFEIFVLLTPCGKRLKIL